MFFHDEHEEIIKQNLDETLQISVLLCEMQKELRQALGAISADLNQPGWLARANQEEINCLYSIDKSHQMITEDVFHMRKEINSPAWLPELVSSLSELSEAVRGLIKIVQDKEFLEEICINTMALREMKKEPKKKAIRKKIAKPKTISQS
jgi:hypothetical protein